jgi:Domain of unknown function (DUF4167)
LINNRQGGRRRGRGGQRGQGGQLGNRQDNRQRGNAAQLLEKYKSMARDAQLSGDRVQTEYYLQFADHYFRVLGENRARFDEPNQRRSRDDEDEDEGEREEEMAEAEGGEAAGDDRSDRNERQPRRERGRRPERDERPPRRAESTDDSGVDDSDERPAGRKRSNGRAETAMPLSALPPAIGRGDEPEAEPQASEEEAPKPRRRSKARPAAGDDEVAPAA